METSSALSIAQCKSEPLTSSRKDHQEHSSIAKNVSTSTWNWIFRGREYALRMLKNQLLPSRASVRTTHMLTSNDVI